MFVSAGDAYKCQEYWWAVRRVVTASEGLSEGAYVAVLPSESTFPGTWLLVPAAVAFHARGAQLPGAVAKSSHTWFWQGAGAGAPGQDDSTVHWCS